MILRRFAAPLILLASVSPALAHTGHGAGSFLQGLAHPLGGLDHMLAMVAVGLYAAVLGGRALWLVPAGFLGAMAIGALLGFSGITIGFVETGIAMSVVALGLAIALRLSPPAAAAMALVAPFAIFHGYAHGAEMPSELSAFVYLMGFMLATALLHAIGIAFGLTVGMFAERGGRRIAQVAGAAIAFIGVALLVSAV